MPSSSHFSSSPPSAPTNPFLAVGHGRGSNDDDYDDNDYVNDEEVELWDEARRSNYVYNGKTIDENGHSPHHSSSSSSSTVIEMVPATEGKNITAVDDDDDSENDEDHEDSEDDDDLEEDYDHRRALRQHQKRRRKQKHLRSNSSSSPSYHDDTSSSSGDDYHQSSNLPSTLLPKYMYHYIYPPHVPRSIQLYRLENLAVPCCYLLVGILQGLSGPFTNVYPLDLNASEAQQVSTKIEWY